MTLNRRRFLGGVAAGAGVLCLGPVLPGAGDRRREDAGDEVLVLLQLSGGNDGLNTVIPAEDDAYGRNRQRLRIDPGEVLPLDERLGLHPSLGGFHELWDEGRLAVVNGAGYPDPDRSHFESMDVWHAADRRGRMKGTGWVGRLADTTFPAGVDPNLVIHVGNRVPWSLKARVNHPVAFSTPSAYRWTGGRQEVETLAAAAPLEQERDGSHPPGREAVLRRLRRVLHEARNSSEAVRKAVAGYSPRADYPGSPVAGRLATVAALISGGLSTRIFSLEMRGFDTHVNQRPVHARLLDQLGTSVRAFYKDLEARGHHRRVCMLAFSEFGRRVRENASGGTDHGTAGPVFVMGGCVRGGLYGRYPGLEELDRGDLVHTTDFRRVYATVIERWLGGRPDQVLGRSYQPLDFLPSRR